MRHFPEGFHADRLLRGVLAPPPPRRSPPPLASTPLNPRTFCALFGPGAGRQHPASPILLVQLQVRS